MASADEPVAGQIVIPNSITTIESEAFSGCTGITSVVILASVTSIGAGAFLGCDSLSAVYFTGTSAQRGSVAIGGLNDPFLRVEKYFYDGGSGISLNIKTFPDYTFRGWVLTNCDMDEDGFLIAEESTCVTAINVNSMEIGDLTVLRYFPQLSSLACCYNQLTALDLSHIPH